MTRAAYQPDFDGPLAEQAGLIVIVGERPGDAWHVWSVGADGVGVGQVHLPGEELPDSAAANDRCVVLVPSALAPVREIPIDGMSVAQALAAVRLDPPGLIGNPVDLHIATAPSDAGDSILVSIVSRHDMDVWLAEIAAAGIDADAVVPVAAILPSPAEGELVVAELAGQAIARSRDAMFAAEPALTAAFGRDLRRSEITPETRTAMLTRAWEKPPIDLRQGIFAKPRVSYFSLPGWRHLARMAAVLALIILTIFLVDIAKLHLDANAREEAALTAARAEFPGVADLSAAERQVSAELRRRGAGASGFFDATPSVFAAMQPYPSMRLRNIDWSGDGLLAIRASSSVAQDLEALVSALQRDGWQVTSSGQAMRDADGQTIAELQVFRP